MSKSVEGSYINLTDSLEEIQSALAGAPTDSGRGDVAAMPQGVRNLMTFVELFQGADRRAEYEAAYASTGLRYGDLKKELAEAIFTELQPIQAKRAELEQNPSFVNEVMADGARRANALAQQTLLDVKQKIGLS